jgi:Tripartite tricarboxylate transporter TctB family
MLPRTRSTQDIAAGAVVIALAVAVLVALSRIPTAKYQSISPDLFPRVCAWLLAAGGIALLVRGWLRAGASIERPAWRGVLLVVSSVVVFGLVAPRLGYAPAGFLTIVIAGLAARDAKPYKLVVFAFGLIAFSVLLFSYALKVPMPAFALRGLGF